MSNVVSVIRTEKKYSITSNQKNVLLHRLSMVMESDKHGSDCGYMVRSLYFDSIYDNDYFDKINGLEFRKKIRLRIYSADQENVKLELKQKRGAAQSKQSLVITKQLATEMITGNYIGLLNLSSSLAQEFYQILETGVYRPKCIVEYRRAALVEDSNDIRITFDCDIGVSYDCENFFKTNLPLTVIKKEPVLEVKYNGFLFSNIKQILDFADASELAISKYAMARQFLGI